MGSWSPFYCFLASHYFSTAHLAPLHQHNTSGQALENLFQFTYNCPNPLASLKCDLTPPPSPQQALPLLLMLIAQGSSSPSGEPQWG